MVDFLFRKSTPNQWAEMLQGPLELAARHGNRDLVQKLIEAGVPIGDALHEAVAGGHGDVVNDLLDKGASIAAKDSRDGESCLHAAAAWGRTELMQLLFLKGADIDALDDMGATPLWTAAKMGNVDAARALLAAGADTNTGRDERMGSILHLVAPRKNVDMLRLTIEHGADLNAIDQDHETALHCAVLCSAGAEVIDVLVEAGANIEARDIDGSTPLHFAARNLAAQGLIPEELIALVKHGARVNAQDGGLQTPLHCVAIQAGFQEDEDAQESAAVVDFLLRSGADETIVDADGMTAADIVGEVVVETRRLAEDVVRVRQLLANAPVDMAWRRRGYLVLCRALPDRVHRIPKSSSARTGMAWRTRSRSKIAKTETIGRGEIVGGEVAEQNEGGWIEVTAKVLGLQEEGIFRTIVGYL